MRRNWHRINGDNVNKIPKSHRISILPTLRDLLETREDKLHTYPSAYSNWLGEEGLYEILISLKLR